MAVDQALTEGRIPHKYENEKLSYIQPEQKRSYLVDFTLDDCPQAIIEAKGRFTSADRKKMLLLKAQYPDREIVMIFGRSANTLSKASKTTYGAWCDKHDIKWLDISQLKADPTCLLSTIKRKRSGNSGSRKVTLRNCKRSLKSASKSSLEKRRKQPRKRHTTNG